LPAGDGIGSPFEIATVGNLMWMAENPSQLNRNFVLMADIDATTLTHPIGNSGGGITNFTGTFNGNGNAITVNINQPSMYSVGLFSRIGANGTIQNLEVRGTVVGGTSTGGIAGSTQGTSVTIHNSSSRANVTGTDFVGGIVGTLNSGSDLAYSFATGNITSTTVGSGVGGLVGQMNSGSAVRNTYATGAVTSPGSQVGGLVGNNIGGVISFSYASGTVNGNTSVGGIVGGMSGGTLSFSVALNGNVNANWGSGRVVGTNSGALWSNHARADMYLDGSVFGGAANATHVNGLSVAVSSMTSSWWAGLGWSASHWNLSGDIPVLVNVPNPSTQNPFVPPVATMISIFSFGGGFNIGVLPPDIVLPDAPDFDLFPPEDDEELNDDDMKEPDDDEGYDDDETDDDDEDDYYDTDDDYPDDVDIKEPEEDEETDVETDEEGDPDYEVDPEDDPFDNGDDEETAAIRSLLWKGTK